MDQRIIPTFNMSKQYPLPSGMRSFYNEQREFVCTGAMMGRMDDVPEEGAPWPKLYLFKMDMFDGAYDSGGAYWGVGDFNTGWMYRVTDGRTINIFIRAKNRKEAKSEIVSQYPRARFHC